MPNLDDRYAPENRGQAIIDHESGTLVALAGPGTGKTYSLRKRARELVLHRGIDADGVAYITFIRAITREFENELREEFTGEECQPDIRVSTLHGLALGLIRNKGAAIGMVGHHEPLKMDSDEDLLVRLLHDDMRSHTGLGSRGAKLRDIRSALAEAKTQWQQGIGEPELSPKRAALLRGYSRLSRAYEALDWDELVLRANRICDTIPNLPRWLDRLDHFLIDEYQDFNPSEQTFLQHLTTSAESVVIVGDDDQSLYSGRGAQPSGIVSLSEDGNLDHVSLVYSWRCPNGVLEAANRFLGWMRDNPRELKARSEGGVVEAFSFKSAKAEAEWLAAQIEAWLNRKGPGEPAEEGVACLFPSTKVLAHYKRVLQARGIGCAIPKAVDLTAEKQWARILLRLACLRTQPLLERALLSHFSELKPRHCRDVVDGLLAAQGGVRDAVAMCATEKGWSAPALSAAVQYEDFVQSLTSLKPGEVHACIGRVLGDSVGSTAERVEQFLEEADTDLERAVDSFLLDVFDSAAGIEGQNLEHVLELYTMQGAKGLTRGFIILPGCESMFLPRKAAGVDLEEEKRLFYVAVTRAKERVLITSPRTRAANDPLCRRKWKGREISPFVYRLGVPVIELR